MQFKDLHLDESLLRAISEEGYETPTPVQEAAIPAALAGEDLLATAQTGTGKTAAFALPILQNLEAPKAKGSTTTRALVLAPTRELALQIEASFRTYGRHMPYRTAVILGGVSPVPQIAALRKGADIIVATPGRLIDLYRQGHARLDRVEFLVLDEADRMLDMGFAPDVRKIVGKLPRERQTMLFSATLSSEIAKMSSDMLRDPTKVTVSPAASVSTNITQQVMFVEQMDKRRLLSEILTEKSTLRALVFTRTKHRANRVVRQLLGEGIKADAIHSNKSQAARQRALSAFHGGRIKVLVATDIAARGIDVEGISHVINYEMPNDPESYVHRIGRTARAGSAGMAMSFCNADEIPLLGGIEKLTRSPLVPVKDHKFHSDAIALLHNRRAPARSGVTQVKPARPHFGRKQVAEGPSTRRGRR
jgi:ATP-dependent RNA helicase RhlE